MQIPLEKIFTDITQKEKFDWRVDHYTIDEKLKIYRYILRGDSDSYVIRVSLHHPGANNNGVLTFTMSTRGSITPGETRQVRIECEFPLSVTSALDGCPVHKYVPQLSFLEDTILMVRKKLLLSLSTYDSKSDTTLLMNKINFIEALYYKVIGKALNMENIFKAVYVHE